MLNAIHYFSDTPFLIINPDTIWNLNYTKEIKLIEKLLFENKESKCSILVTPKKKSFDKSFKGDFNLKNNLIYRNKGDDLQYIYTGVQIIKPEVFLDYNSKIFSINEIWNQLIKNNELYGVKSNNDFFHVSTLNIYKNLAEKFKY